ncbi:MAG: restriction endonuclease subunit S [Tenuifilaceae bacterium]|nr:restriction endonuclease subunit S [Tenuifilaceae bacterium]
MSKEKLIPELRFPEFIGKDEWKLDNVNSLFDLQDGYPFSSKVFTSNTKNGRQVIRITDINNQNKNSEKVYIPEDKIDDLGISAYSVENGDLLLSLTGAAGFNFYIWGNGAAFINQRTMKITPRDSKNEFLKVILSPLIHEKINGIGTGQNNNLSKDALKAIQFPVPQPQEQQKIASCLSSLDELIAAHKDKLDALKDHKKGLLQNLFPQEGETVPKVRFPEFEDDGEWVEDDIGTLFKFKQGVQVPVSNQFPEQGDDMVRFIRIIDITSNNEPPRYIQHPGDSHIISKDDLFMIRYGTPGLISIGFEGVIANNLFRLIWKSEKRNQPKFWFYAFQRLESFIYNLSSSSSMPAISFSTLEGLKIGFPPTIEEQQKIASCLSALDELITSQQEKIDQLQQHKKGLMQGLFPKIES